MTKLKRLQLESSEKRQRLNALLALDSITDEQRAELGTLTTRMQEIEVETRAAIVAEPPPVDTIEQEDGEGRELRALRSRVEFRPYVAAALEKTRAD